MKHYRKISGAEYFLAFNEDVLGQELLSQCDEMLIRFCFSRGASALSLLTMFSGLLVSRKNYSNCTTFICGAVTNNAKLGLVLFIYSGVSTEGRVFLTRSALGESAEVK